MSKTSLRFRLLKAAPFLAVPALLAVVTSFMAFRQPVVSVLSMPGDTLILPPGWAPPPVPADNPITSAKFVLGRQLFYETALSADGSTSCSTCHDPYGSFSKGESHTGAFGIQGLPARTVPRLENVAYDTVLTWDGHIQTLEEQVEIAVQKKGDLGFSSGLTDTATVFQNLQANPAYSIMFTQAFGDPAITLDRIAKAVATFERCLISGGSAYDQYVNGNTSAMDSSQIRGMNLFFDTTKTNCSECHNNLGSQGVFSSANIFTDNNYYRTGTFEPPQSQAGGGYGFPTPTDSVRDPGRAAVTGDSNDIGKFRTPSLRNVCITSQAGSHFGADGTQTSISQIIEIYNQGGSGGTIIDTEGHVARLVVPNQDPRIKPLGLTSANMTDLEAFLNSLNDYDYISDTAFQDPGPPAAWVDDHVIEQNLSLYPNPSPGNVNVECPDLNGTVSASLVSESGQTVWQSSVKSDGKLAFEFPNVANGAYRLLLRTANQSESVPFIIQH